MMLSTILAVLIAVSQQLPPAMTGDSTPYITRLDNFPGIMIEKIATLAINDVNWKIVQKLDMAQFSTTAQTLENALETLVKRYNDGSAISRLMSLQTQLRESRSDITRIGQLLQNSEPRTGWRHKRSLLPPVGAGLKLLFGTLDEKTEGELKNMIEISANDTRRVAKLLANQTELIEVQLGKNTMMLNKLQRTLAVLSLQARETETTTSWQNAVSIMEENILNFKIDTNILVEIISFGIQGQIHPRLLSPEIIMNSKTLIENAVVDATFPLADGGERIADLAKIAEVTMTLIGKYLIYVIDIPLLDSCRYQLFKASPVPVKQNFTDLAHRHIFAYINPKHKYFAINSNKFIPFREADFHKCKEMNQVLICKNFAPIREIPVSSSCEIDIALNKSISDILKCDVRLTKMHDTYWMNLHEHNSWLFSTTGEEKLFIHCRKVEHITAVIQGTGILRLQSGCTAFTADAKLSASRTIIHETSTINFPKICLNVSSILETANHTAGHEGAIHEILQTEILQDNQSSVTSQEEVTKVGKSLREIISKAQSLGNYKSVSGRVHAVETQLPLTTVLSVSLIVSLIGMWKCFKSINAISMAFRVLSHLCPLKRTPSTETRERACHGQRNERADGQQIGSFETSERAKNNRDDSKQDVLPSNRTSMSTTDNRPTLPCFTFEMIDEALNGESTSS